MTMRYRTIYGESPTTIARRFGVTRDALVSANPHKPTTVVAGQRTWSSLGVGEELTIPGLGDPGLGDAASDAINALVAAGGPCVQRNAGLVCAAQRALGVTVDGKWGSGSAGAAKGRAAVVPSACSPTPSFWIKGQSACPSGGLAPAPLPPIITPVSTSSIPAIPVAAAALASGIDPCLSDNVSMVCAAQRALGVTADGKYGANTAAALRRFVPNAPPPCSPRPGFWKPAGQSNCDGGTPVVTPPILNLPPLPLPIDLPPLPLPIPAIPIPSGPAPIPILTSTPPLPALPAAVQAFIGVNPCDPANVALVCAVQAAVGVTVDGKYGNATAAAVRKILPGAPAGCSPRPAHWLPPGQSNCNRATLPLPLPIPSLPPTPVTLPPPPVIPPIIPTPIPLPAPLPLPAPSPAPTPDTPSGVTIPEKKALSTGAIVAGTVGAVALVGVIAIAAMSSKRGTRGARGTRGPRGAARRKSPKRKKR